MRRDIAGRLVVLVLVVLVLVVSVTCRGPVGGVQLLVGVGGGVLVVQAGEDGEL